MGTNAKQDAKSQRIAALEQLISVLRRQQAGMRRSLADKDERIAVLEERVRTLLGRKDQIGWIDEAGHWHKGLMPLDAAQNSVAIYRNDGESG